ncbi:MAG: class I SAM-dependent methyltransferase [Limisphaerales bacterium]
MPATDPRAIASRRDLQRLNRWLGHQKFVRRALTETLKTYSKPRLVEIGCGDATFALQVLKQFPSGEITLVDRQATIAPETLNGFASIGWKAQFVNADIFDWLPRQDTVDCMMADLFLHHFEFGSLRKLFELIAARTNVFIACEPRRDRNALIGSYVLTYATCTAVTRYDAPVSIRAGFRNKELSELWPKGNWDLREEDVGIGSHMFIATKKCQNQSP